MKVIYRCVSVLEALLCDNLKNYHNVVLLHLCGLYSHVSGIYVAYTAILWLQDCYSVKLVLFLITTLSLRYRGVSLFPYISTLILHLQVSCVIHAPMWLVEPYYSLTLHSCRIGLLSHVLGPMQLNSCYSLTLVVLRH